MYYYILIATDLFNTPKHPKIIKTKKFNKADNKQL